MPLTEPRTEDQTFSRPEWLHHAWSEYKQRPQRHLREQLIVHYMGGHVRRIAERTDPRCLITSKSMISCSRATLGWWNPLNGSSPNWASSSRRSVRRRISGSMEDWLRSQDHPPRLMRTFTENSLGHRAIQDHAWPRTIGDRASSSPSSGSMKRRSSNASRSDRTHGGHVRFDTEQRGGQRPVA